MKGRLEQIVSASAAAIGLLGALFGAFLAKTADTEISGGGSGAQLPVLIGALLSTVAAAVVSIIMARQVRASRLSKKVFVSYSHADLASAQQISHILKKNGFEPWLAMERILPGQMWKEEIDNALRASGAVVMLISKHFEESSFAQKETTDILRRVRATSTKSLPVIPIRLDATLPPAELADVQWLDMGQPDAERKLLDGLRAVIAERTEPRFKV